MFFTQSRTAQRHRFIERSIEGAHDALRNPHVAQRLGNYAAHLAAVEARLYVPNIRHGRLTAPTEYQNKDMVPVVALGEGQKLKVGSDFGRLSPRQRQQLMQVVSGWGPLKETPASFAAKIEDSATAAQHKWLGKTGLEADDFAAVAYRSLGITIKGTNLSNAPEVARYRLKSRPFVKLKFTDGHPLPPQLMLHEYEHIDQHEREPLTLAADDDQETIIDKSYELEAYHVGSLCVLGLVASGEEVDDIGDQVQIDAIRQEVNGVGFFEYNQEIESRLVAADILHLED